MNIFLDCINQIVFTEMELTYEVRWWTGILFCLSIFSFHLRKHLQLEAKELKKIYSLRQVNLLNLKGYLCYKTITSQNAPSEA